MASIVVEDGEVSALIEMRDDPVWHIHPQALQRGSFLCSKAMEECAMRDGCGVVTMNQLQQVSNMFPSGR